VHTTRGSTRRCLKHRKHRPTCGQESEVSALRLLPDVGTVRKAEEDMIKVLDGC
jgi:hypothetical protein